MFKCITKYRLLKQIEPLHSTGVPKLTPGYSTGLSGKNKTGFPYWHCSHKIVGPHHKSQIYRKKKIFILDFIDFVPSVDFISSSVCFRTT